MHVHVLQQCSLGSGEDPPKYIHVLLDDTRGKSRETQNRCIFPTTVIVAAAVGHICTSSKHTPVGVGFTYIAERTPPSASSPPFLSSHICTVIATVYYTS